MFDLSNPDLIHECLIYALIAVLVAALVCAVFYIWALALFFAELKHKEPAVWESVGSPDIVRMFFQQNAHNTYHMRAYYAFFPVLRARAKSQTRSKTDPFVTAETRQESYRHARRAYALLRLGLGLAALMALIVAAMVLIFSV
jgi:hypothetical protein